MKLYIAMNLTFACSMSYGEICGLTWDKVYISYEDIANDDSLLAIRLIINIQKLSPLTFGTKKEKH